MPRSTEGGGAGCRSRAQTAKSSAATTATATTAGLSTADRVAVTAASSTRAWSGGPGSHDIAGDRRFDLCVRLASVKESVPLRRPISALVGRKPFYNGLVAHASRNIAAVYQHQINRRKHGRHALPSSNSGQKLCQARRQVGQPSCRRSGCQLLWDAAMPGPASSHKDTLSASKRCSPTAAWLRPDSLSRVTRVAT